MLHPWETVAGPDLSRDPWTVPHSLPDSHGADPLVQGCPKLQTQESEGTSIVWHAYLMHGPGTCLVTVSTHGAVWAWDLNMLVCSAGTFQKRSSHPLPEAWKQSALLLEEMSKLLGI